MTKYPSNPVQIYVLVAPIDFPVCKSTLNCIFEVAQESQLLSNPTVFIMQLDELSLNEPLPTNPSDDFC